MVQVVDDTALPQFRTLIPMDLVVGTEKQQALALLSVSPLQLPLFAAEGGALGSVVLLWPAAAQLSQVGAGSNWIASLQSFLLRPSPSLQRQVT